jgi:hypothetical protein
MSDSVAAASGHAKMGIADYRSRRLFVIKKLLSISLFFLFGSFAWLIAPASAAKKTMQECEALAHQRGFVEGNAEMAGRPKGFIRACMSGKQQ